MTTTLLNDQTATDRILDAACTTAIAFIRGGRRDRAEVALKAAGISAAMLLGEGPASGGRTYDARDNAGPWAHDDGSPCGSHWSDRPNAPDGTPWWCTEHQQYLHAASGSTP